MWVETVAEGGRRFTAAWRKEEVDAARHRQEKREAARLGKFKVVTAHGSVESCEAITIDPADDLKESLCRRETD